jgi:hypothetical protein
MMVTEILMYFEGFSHYFSLIQRISFNAQAHDSICLKAMLQFRETSTVVMDQLTFQASSSWLLRSQCILRDSPIIQRISFNAQVHDLICLKAMLKFQETSTMIMDQLTFQGSS